jgi:FKBP-type peptidyl-prolyl cis-trans isomerase
VSQAGQPAAAGGAGIVIVNQTEDQNQARAEAYVEASDNRGNITRMVIDDVKLGVGEQVQKGDTIAVHYIGRLQNGQEFDNSRTRGETFEFKVGSGMVIKGWDEGVIGMQIGGERILVIPPEMAYGENGVGPIPSNATLIFSVELVSIN